MSSIESSSQVAPFPDAGPIHVATRLIRNRMKRKPSGEHRDPIRVYGMNPVFEFLKAHPEHAVRLHYARKDRRGEALLALCREVRVPVSITERRELDTMAGHPHHQGVLLILRRFPYADFESMLRSEHALKHPWLLLDCLQDPQNFGAILRSACFLGVPHVIFPKDRSVPITSSVIKTAAGAVAHLKIARVTNLARSMEQLKERGIWLVGLDASGSVSIYDADLTGPIGLVIGNEHHGIRPLIRKNCDFLARIPAHGPLDSLNAASAAAIALAELMRQRSASS